MPYSLAEMRGLYQEHDWVHIQLHQDLFYSIIDIRHPAARKEVRRAPSPFIRSAARHNT
jgi:hypothetical protein